jgi:hypothetical protein
MSEFAAAKVAAATSRLVRTDRLAADDAGARLADFDAGGPPQQRMLNSMRAMCGSRTSRFIAWNACFARPTRSTSPSAGSDASGEPPVGPTY